MKIIIITLLVIAGVYGVGKAYDIHMQSYCMKLQAQAEEFKDNPHYYITSLDSKECKEVYGITINAIIK